MNRQALWIFITALVLRIAFLLATPPRPQNWDDSTQWNKTATYFMEGRGFIQDAQDLDPKRPPVYPLFMAGNYLLFGSGNATAVKHAQATVGALTCVLIYLLVQSLIGPVTAAAAGYVCAVYPPLIVYTGILQSETLYIFLLFAFLLSWVTGSRKSDWRWFALAGVLLGLANLTRGTLLFFTPWILAGALIARDERSKIKHYLLMIALSIAVMLPWTLRNYKVYGGFMPVASGGSEMFWFGTLPWEEQRLFGLSPAFQSYSGIENPIELERKFSHDAIANIKNDPDLYFLLCIKKFLFFWFQPVGQKLTERIFPALGMAMFAMQALLILLFLFGILKTVSQWQKFIPFYLLLLYFTALHTVVAPEPRYRLPIEPILLIFTVYSLLLLFQRKRVKPETL